MPRYFFDIDDGTIKLGYSAGYGHFYDFITMELRRGEPIWNW